MNLIEIDVMDGRGKITACVNTVADASRISALCRWAKKQDEALESLREAAQAVVNRWDTPLWKDVPAPAEFINKLRAELEKKS